MEDSKDTIIISGIGEKVVGEDFIKHFSGAGEIQTGKNTGQRLALMKYFPDSPYRQGIVTYADVSRATEAVKMFDGKDFKGNVIEVTPADQYYKFGRKDSEHFGSKNFDGNMAWMYWMRGQRRGTGGGEDRIGGRGGEGGKGGGFWSWLSGRGQDGEPGEDGPNGGKGGKGGKGGSGWF